MPQKDSGNTIFIAVAGVFLSCMTVFAIFYHINQFAKDSKVKGAFISKEEYLTENTQKFDLHKISVNQIFDAISDRTF